MPRTSNHLPLNTNPDISILNQSFPKSSKKYLIVGAGWAGKSIASEIIKQKRGKVIGFVDDNLSKGPISITYNEINYSINIIGISSNLYKIALSHNADVIVIAVTNDRNDHLLRQIVHCFEKQISVIEMPTLYAKLTKKLPVKHLSHHWITPNLTQPKNSFYSVFFEVTNYIVSLAIFFLILIPFFPIVFVLIKIDSPGPVFYKQKRIGKNGNPFYLLKLRTMTENADQLGSKWTLKEDKRITRLGKWLRKFRIDEAPQLINIFKGEMALIGPRPEAVELVEEFTQAIPFYQYRYLVKPGITGWAQINYENTCSIKGALEKLQYDLFWIKKRSVLLDIKILVKTLKVIITGFGTD